MAEGQRLEALHILRQLPQKVVILADGAVARHRSDQRYLIHATPLPVQQ